MKSTYEEYAHDYKIVIHLWTGSMNEYHSEVIESLSKWYADMLFDAIQVDGGVTQVDMLKGITRIKTKMDMGNGMVAVTEG